MNLTELACQTGWADWLEGGAGSVGLGLTLLALWTFLAAALLFYLHVWGVEAGLNDAERFFNSAYVIMAFRTLPAATRVALADFAVQQIGSEAEAEAEKKRQEGSPKDTKGGGADGKGGGEVEEVLVKNLVEGTAANLRRDSASASGAKTAPGLLDRRKSEDLGVKDRVPAELLTQVGILSAAPAAPADAKTQALPHSNVLSGHGGPGPGPASVAKTQAHSSDGESTDAPPFPAFSFKTGDNTTTEEPAALTRSHAPQPSASRPAA